MGKGEIISSLGDGQYQVKLIYDTRKIDAAIQSLDAAITAIDNKITGTGSPPSPPLEGKLLELAKLEKAALETRKKYLQNHKIAERIVSAWCADLTTDLTGIVGTIEVPGERAGGGNIKPGYENDASYDTGHDGQIQAALAGTPAGTFYNLAMLPGWQKWKPTYRYGRITAKRGSVCDIVLDAARSSQTGKNKKTSPGLNVNKAENLSDVPIQYMDCDCEAFAVGDSVLIEFTDRDWSKPQVIGFKDHPKPCGGGTFEFHIYTAEGRLLDPGELASVTVNTQGKDQSGKVVYGIPYSYRSGNPYTVIVSDEYTDTKCTLSITLQNMAGISDHDWVNANVGVPYVSSGKYRVNVPYLRHSTYVEREGIIYISPMDPDAPVDVRGWTDFDYYLYILSTELHNMLTSAESPFPGMAYTTWFHDWIVASQFLEKYKDAEFDKPELLYPHTGENLLRIGGVTILSYKCEVGGNVGLMLYSPPCYPELWHTNKYGLMAAPCYPAEGEVGPECAYECPYGNRSWYMSCKREVNYLNSRNARLRSYDLTTVHHADCYFVTPDNLMELGIIPELFNGSWQDFHTILENYHYAWSYYHFHDWTLPDPENPPVWQVVLDFFFDGPDGYIEGVNSRLPQVFSPDYLKSEERLMTVVSNGRCRRSMPELVQYSGPVYYSYGCSVLVQPYALSAGAEHYGYTFTPQPHVFKINEDGSLTPVEPGGE